MNQNPSFKEIFADVRNTFDYIFEKVVFTFTKRLGEVLKEKNLSKNDLAKKIGCTAPYVSKVFSGAPNLTLASMVKIAEAVDCELAIDLRPKSAKVVAKVTTLIEPSKEAAALQSSRFTPIVVQETFQQNLTVENIGPANEQFALAA